MEHEAEHVPWIDALLTRPNVVVDGRFQLPEGPGWGADIDEAIIRAHPASAHGNVR
jgi:L-alanine-DL-glutamate epimerase-like enolase superfamily enzyme